MTHLSSIALIALNACLNVAGVTLLKHAWASGNPVHAILGCLCWGATSAVFFTLLKTGQPLAILSTATSSVGFLAVIAVDYFLFGQTLSHRQLIGVGVMIFGMALLALPSGA